MRRAGLVVMCLGILVGLVLLVDSGPQARAARYAETDTRAVPRVPSAMGSPVPWTLAALVHDADAIVHVRVTNTNGAMHSIIVYATAVEWLKRSNPAAHTALTIWVPNPYMNEFRVPPSFWDTPGAEAILFLQPDGVSPWDQAPAYALIGPPGTVAGLYRVQNGRITYAGLPPYQNWTARAFKAAIAGLLHPPGPAGPAGPPARPSPGPTR